MDEASCGIYDLGSRFGVIYPEIARGVTDTMGKRCVRDEWWDMLQDIAREAWDLFRANPECFATPIDARRWASHAAYHRRIDRKRMQQCQVLRDEAVARQNAVCNFELQSISEEIEEQERRREIVSALQLLPAESRSAIIETFFRGLSHRAAAAELGTSKSTLERWLETGLRSLALSLAAWNPRPSSRGGNRDQSR